MVDLVATISMGIKNNGDVVSSNNFNGNFGGDFVNGDKLLGHKPPPLGHPNSRDCPQCWKLTWRVTRHCVECGCDIWHQDELREQAKRKEVLKKRSACLYVATGIFLLALFISMNFLSNIFTVVFFFLTLFSLSIGSKLDEVSSKL